MQKLRSFSFERLRDGAGAPFSRIDLASYPPGAAMAMHAHRDTSLTLVLSGRYEERIRGRCDVAENGTLLVCPPEESHAQHFGPGTVRKLVLTPTPQTIEGLGENVRLARTPAARSRSLANLAQRMARELLTADDFSALILCGLSHELIGLSARERIGPAGVLPRKLRIAMEFMREHTLQAFALDAVAAAAGCDAGELARAFRAHLGSTPGEYHRRMRVERAMALLEESRVPLSDIAQMCGFSDQPHMTRAFKTQVGITPGAYRRERTQRR